MKKEIALGIAIAVATPLVAADRDYDLAGFSRVDAGTGIDVTVVVGGDHAVSAEVSRNGLFRKLEIAREGDTLVIRRNATMSFFMMGVLDRYAVTVHLPELDGIAAKSGSDVNAYGPITGPLDVVASSGADVTISGVAATSVALQGSSGANVTVTGTCDSLDVRATSGADVVASGLLCGAVTALAKSGSDVALYAQNTATTEAKSGADIDLFGPATVLHQSAKSNGQINRMN